MKPSPDDVPVRTVAEHAEHAEISGDARRSIAFRRSLHASRERRRTAALRRRRTLRSRRSALVAAAGLALLSTAALADNTGGADPSAPPATDLSKKTIKAAQRALGLEDDGVVGPKTRKATRRFQRKHGLEPDGLLGPETLKALGVKATGSAARAAKAGEAATLARIAECESGGDPAAISADGIYRGKYQFDRATWRLVGGKGDPAAAPEAEQDTRALRLLRRKGTTPWPNCA